MPESPASPHKKIKIVLVAAILGCILAVGAIFVQSRLAVQPAQVLNRMAADAIMSLANVRQTATKDGAVQWHLEAKSAQLNDKRHRMELAAPRVEFFLEDGSRAILTADTGVLDTETNDIQVSGNVRVKNDRYVLQTETLSYQHADRVLMSRQPVHIAGQAFELMADSMTYHLNSNQALFSGAVNGRIREKLAL